MYISTLDRIDMDKYDINEAASVLVDTSVNYFLEHNDDSLLYCLSKGLYQPILEEEEILKQTTDINTVQQERDAFSNKTNVTEKQKQQNRSASARDIQTMRNLILNKKKGFDYLTSSISNLAGKGRDFLASLLDKLQAKLAETDEELRKNDKDPQKAGMWNSLKSKIVAAIRAVSTKLHNLIQRDRGNIYNRYNSDDGSVKVNEKYTYTKEGDMIHQTLSLPKTPANEAYTSQSHRLGFFNRSQVRCINESDYGISVGNKFPMTNRAEVVAAMNNFNIVPINERAELARNITAKAHKFNVPIRGSRFLHEEVKHVNPLDFSDRESFAAAMADPDTVFDFNGPSIPNNTPKMPNQVYKRIDTSTDNIPAYGSAANHNVEKTEPGYIEKFVRALKEYAMKGKQYLLQAIDIANKKVANLRVYLQNAAKDKPTLIKWGQMAINKILFVIEWLTQKLHNVLS